MPGTGQGGGECTSLPRHILLRIILKRDNIASSRICLQVSGDGVHVYLLLNCKYEIVSSTYPAKTVLARSADSGQTWETIAHDLGVTAKINGEKDRLMTSTTGQYVFYTRYYGGPAYRSDNYGLTFTAIANLTAGGLTRYDVVATATDANGQTVVIFAKVKLSNGQQRYELYRSDAYGQSGTFTFIRSDANEKDGALFLRFVDRDNIIGSYPGTGLKRLRLVPGSEWSTVLGYVSPTGSYGALALGGSTMVTGYFSFDETKHGPMSLSTNGGTTWTTIGRGTDDGNWIDADCADDGSVCVVAPWEERNNLAIISGRSFDRPEFKCGWSGVACSRGNGCGVIYAFCIGHGLMRLERRF
jgi:hypothetical protein